MKLKEFVKKVCPSLDKYKDSDCKDLLNGCKPHCHSCLDLDKKQSRAAKKLVSQLIKINNEWEDKAKQIELHNVLQLYLKGIDELPYRCFGYIDEGVYNIVYFDPKHEVYEE